MASAKKLPSGSWRVQLFVGVNEKGKRMYKSFTAATKKEAEFAAAQYNLTRKESVPEMTVGEAIEAYISAKEHVLSPSTIHGYRVTAKNHLAVIRDVPLSKLDNVAIQGAVNLEAVRCSPKTVRNAYGLLTAALSMFVPDFRVRVTLPAKEHKIKDLPTPSEVMEAVRGSSVELPAMLALWLGLRMSEVRGIQYGDISGGVLTINRVRIEMDGEIVKDRAKTYNSTRRLAVPKPLRDMIGNGARDEWVVKLAARTIHKNFTRLIKEHTGKEMTFHDLRHLNASVMLALGVPDKYAMERGGWSTNATLKSVYQHTFTAERVAVDAKVDAYFADVLSEVMQHEKQHGKK